MFTLSSKPGLAAVLIAAFAGGCGGGAVAEEGVGLFGADGQASDAARQRPADIPATRSGLYATPAQVEWELLTAAPYTVVVDLDAFATPADALERALANHAWSTDHRGVGHFVRGGTPQEAATVADALSAHGVASVFLVAAEGRAGR